MTDISENRKTGNRESGIALFAVLIVLILLGSSIFYSSANAPLTHSGSRDTLLQQLTKAKAALIAYAVIDTNRPGRLLCPDLLGNGISPLLARNDCERYEGKLPWRTLDLADGTDNTGAALVYHLSPLFGGDHKTPPLNSGTETSLHLDLPEGSPSNDIAAVIIAPMGALDSRNADSDSYFYNGKSGTPDDDDLIVAITRQELMAAAEQRVANEVLRCLQEHALNGENTEHTYPWPAPLSNISFSGMTGSRFGMIPNTQAGSPDETLKKSNADLNRLKDALDAPVSESGQLAATLELAEIAGYAQTLYDQLYLSAADLYEKSQLTKANFSALDSDLVAATKNKTVFSATAGSLPASIQAKIPSLDLLQTSLRNSGLDVFTMEMMQQNADLRADITAATNAPNTSTFKALQSQSNIFRNKVFQYSSTPNSEIALALEIGLSSAILASNAALAARNSPESPTLIDESLHSANALHADVNALIVTIDKNRVSLDLRELDFQTKGLQSILGLSTPPSEELKSSILVILQSAKTSVDSLVASNTGLAEAHVAQTTIDEASRTIQTSNHSGDIEASLQTVINALNSLGTRLSNNGDNVTLESFKQASQTLSLFSQYPPPTMAAAEALREPAKAIIYWSDITENHAADLARLARKGVAAEYDSTTSAYTYAKKLLAGLNGQSGAIFLLERYLRDKTPDNQKAAQAAVEKTKTALRLLLAKASSLDESLVSGLAEATVPTVWHGKSCSFLRSANEESWWRNNEWNKFVLYQIGDRYASTPGRLTVNGRGSYKVVVLAAGKPLATQDRTIRKAASFLEGVNGNPTRNDDAKSPSNDFSKGATSPDFNDHLANE